MSKPCIANHRLFFLFFLAPFFNLLQSFDQAVFYHARFFPGEPRFSEQNLSSLTAKIGGGSTKRKNDNCGTPIGLDSTYRIQHIIFTYAQNFSRGVFLSSTTPIYRIQTSEGTEIDFQTTFMSNMNITGGWTINYEDTTSIDFIDITLETGIILPTSKYPMKSKGIIFRGAAALGIYDWISYGIETDAITFFDNKNGRLWNVTCYAKADHFCRGFSFLIGYSHSNQKKSPIPWSEKILPEWTMDTFHFALSFDAATDDTPYAPHIDFFYNHVMNGKNCIENSLFGLTIGTDF